MVEVAVVGGGPAGCSAALALRAAGLAVTVIASPRLREKPTETAVPQLRHLLQSIGAAEALGACEPCYGIQSNWGRSASAPQSIITDLAGHPWFIHRMRFDALLNRLARSAGASWLEAEAEEVAFADDKVTIRTTVATVEASSLVLANGSPAWAARMTQQKPVLVDSLVCFWSRLPTPIESRLLHVETTEHGWWYVCPGEAQSTFACFVTDAENVRNLSPGTPRNWNGLFQATTLRQELGLHGSVDPVQVIAMGVSSLTHRHGRGWIAVGDAAVKLDPIASSGTATAIQSGRMAAQILVDQARGGDQKAKEYDRWGAGMVAEFIRQRTRQYTIQGNRTKDGFWARRVRSEVRPAADGLGPQSVWNS